MAAKLTPLPLLFRADSGWCSLKIMQEISAQAAALSREIAFIIKWNPRRAPVEAIAAQRMQGANTIWCHLREGKRMCLWAEPLNLAGVRSPSNPARRVLRLTERTIDKHGKAHEDGDARADVQGRPHGQACGALGLGVRSQRQCAHGV